MTFSPSFVSACAKAHGLQIRNNPRGLSFYDGEVGVRVSSHVEGFGATTTDRGSVKLGPHFSDADHAGKYILQTILSAARLGQQKPAFHLGRRPAGVKTVREGEIIRITWNDGSAVFCNDWLGTAESKEFMRIAGRMPPEIWEAYEPNAIRG